MKTRIEINKRGVRELLTGREVTADMRRRARNVAAAAGPGMEVKEGSSPYRARFSVTAATYEARRAEAERRVLTKALLAGAR